MTLIETLQAMKNTLLEKGWCQKGFLNSYGQMCLLGSYTHNLHDLSWDQYLDTEVKIIRALGSVEAVHKAGGIFKFNDAPNRTFNEIMDVIDEAILNVKEGESNDLN